jgi:hypothetical protein
VLPKCTEVMYSTGKHLFVRELGGVRTKVGTVGRRRFSNRIDAMADDDELRAQLVALAARLAAVEEAVRAPGRVARDTWTGAGAEHDCAVRQAEGIPRKSHRRSVAESDRDSGGADRRGVVS